MEQHKCMFPWGDSDSELIEVQGPRAAIAKPKSFHAHGVHFWEIGSDKRLAGAILHHCRSGIGKLRACTGGDQLALFKIGITHDYDSRFDLYRSHGWEKMLVLFYSSDLGQVEMLEAALILHYQGKKLAAMFEQEVKA